MPNQSAEDQVRVGSDVAFEFGLRFHTVPEKSLLKSGEIFVAWEDCDHEGNVGLIMKMDRAWPTDIPSVTAVFVRAPDLQEAIAFVRAHLGHGKH